MHYELTTLHNVTGSSVFVAVMSIMSEPAPSSTRTTFVLLFTNDNTARTSTDTACVAPLLFLSLKKLLAAEAEICATRKRGNCECIAT